MKLDDGREVLCTLALPLPADLVGAMGTALTEAARLAGYDGCSVLLDGTNRVVARRIGPPDQADGHGFDDDCEATP